MLASEYGWTKDYILHQVYPAEVFDLMVHIGKRRLDGFVDLLQVQVLTDSNLKSEDRVKVYSSLDEMRDGGHSQPSERKFDRNKFEELRGRMGKRKGKAPVRVG